MKKILIIMPLALLILFLGCTSSALTTMKFQPMQCEQTPWEKWYADGNIQFVKAPTDSELIVAYYSNVYKIELTEVKKVESGNAVCEACGVCPTSYYFSAKVKSSNLAKMTELKWTKI
ncbi:MAG: hypothetical protein AMQ74_01170 [Candidatus Methanofastidiosum methylothiophilum]|uniref:Lipoprotein n=1 Tax=Candidatus Methanofastidiosum methylothiophilum TaxID=1705564 RepID=A0A150J1I3_9EURY|nr:MAG: hypothetical protein AMQ74_01170 [Candidatus Methanofastidiosum methylthiophilus]